MIEDELKVEIKAKNDLKHKLISSYIIITIQTTIIAILLVPHIKII